MSARFLEVSRKAWPYCGYDSRGGGLGQCFPSENRFCDLHSTYASAIASAHARGVEEGIEKAEKLVRAWHLPSCPAYMGMGTCECNIQKIRADLLSHLRTPAGEGG